MYELTNAFDGIDFGSNNHGVLVATTEDHLHSFEAGAMDQLAEVSYHGLSPTELMELEAIIHKKVMNCRSSALSEVPRGTVKKDFGKLTLSSHNEKVGSVFYLLLALHERRGRELLQKAHERQAEKYLSSTVEPAAAKEMNPAGLAIPAADQPEETINEDNDCESSSKPRELCESAFPFRNDLLFGTDHNDKNPFKRSNESIAFICKHLRLHVFGFVLDEEGLDVYQLELLMVASWSILRVMGGNKEYPSDGTVKTLSSCEEIKAQKDV
jgi:hypothetical protein